MVDAHLVESAEQRHGGREFRLITHLQASLQLHGGAAAKLHVGAGQLHMEALDVGLEGKLRHDQITHQRFVHRDGDVVRRQHRLAALEARDDGTQALDLALEHDALGAQVAAPFVAAVAAGNHRQAGDDHQAPRAAPAAAYFTRRHVILDCGCGPPEADAGGGCRYMRSPSNS